jgi:predicted amidohydrolase
MLNFKIAAAQVPSVRGDIDGNITTHAAAIAAAAQHHVSVLVFPELSLTGYEPDLAAELALEPTDGQLVPLLALARQHHIEVVVGAPLRNGLAKPALGAIVMSASGATGTYRKMHLGASERTYFASGDSPLALTVADILSVSRFVPIRHNRHIHRRTLIVERIFTPQAYF